MIESPPRATGSLSREDYFTLEAAESVHSRPALLSAAAPDLWTFREVAGQGGIVLDEWGLILPLERYCV